ncbi:MAG TPA: 50S ribosomal protein L7/L12 [Anaerolineae bacterium]|nr:50S ribosomal protein L7/L12 [Anaerolineae bacterium]
MASEKLEKIVEEIQGLTLLEASELVKLLEERLGVTAAAPVAAVAGAPAPGAPAAPEEEKTEFDVILKEIGPKKIQVIKAVRELTQLGLKEAKAVVDGAPGPVLKGVSKEAAEEAKAKLEAQGAVVEIK